MTQTARAAVQYIAEHGGAYLEADYPYKGAALTSLPALLRAATDTRCSHARLGKHPERPGATVQVTEHTIPLCLCFFRRTQVHASQQHARGTNRRGR